MKCQPISTPPEIRPRDEVRHINAATRKALSNLFHYSSLKKTDEIGSDASYDFDLMIRRALVGRYWICRKLHDDIRYWDEHSGDFSSGPLPREPAVIAAVLAIRPNLPWKWSVVETWSWVYRHALLIDVAVIDFEDWCDLQDPDNSRTCLMSHLRPVNGNA